MELLWEGSAPAALAKGLSEKYTPACLRSVKLCPVRERKEKIKKKKKTSLDNCHQQTVSIDTSFN